MGGTKTKKANKTKKWDCTFSIHSSFDERKTSVLNQIYVSSLRLTLKGSQRCVIFFDVQNDVFEFEFVSKTVTKTIEISIGDKLPIIVAFVKKFLAEQGVACPSSTNIKILNKSKPIPSSEENESPSSDDYFAPWLLVNRRVVNPKIVDKKIYPMIPIIVNRLF
jgi:hypothetical protein